MNIYVTIFAYLSSAVFFALYSKKLLLMQQLNGYYASQYAKAFLKETRTHIAAAACALAAALFGALFHGSGAWLQAVGLLPHLSAAGFAAYRALTFKPKKPLKFTPRLLRLSVCAGVLAAAWTAAAAAVSRAAGGASSGAAALAHALVPLSFFAGGFMHAAAALIAAPVEKKLGKKFIDAARAKLDSASNLIKIGVTGSYGKTSVKRYLAAILEKKFAVCRSPASFNTPAGLARAVNENLKDGDGVFIAEMGARRAGDIERLCDLIRPDYGILNSIGAQHLSTFKTRENVVRAKSELPNFLEKDGLTVFNCDNPETREVYKGFKGNKLSCGGDPSFDVSYGGIKAAEGGGREFTLRYKNESVKCRSRLPGKHGIGNLCAAAALALKLGVDLKTVAAAASEVMPEPHRLQIIEAGALTVIDDAYNSNPEGFRAATDVLTEYGGVKIIVTPGMVELGSVQRAENAEAASYAARRCVNYLIAVGDNAAALKEGWLRGGGAEENFFKSGSLRDAREVLSRLTSGLDKGAVLFENDLPDY